ncbi:hypothetical protein ACFYN3_40420 [Streptomyces lavendulae]|uniref:hypothetical protein n=1 Tax=Streptomyces lavendulae TaxID=1914 RepID=UPI0036C7469B
MSESRICCLNAARASPVSCCCAASFSHLGRNSFSRSSADRLGLARACRARREALDLFPLVPLDPQLGCAKCQDHAHRRDTATGPLRSTVVTDTRVLMKRCAKGGHR